MVKENVIVLYIILNGLKYSFNSIDPLLRFEYLVKMP